MSDKTVSKSVDYETDFFMELLEEYRSILVKKGLSEADITNKLSGKTHINQEAYFDLIKEYEEILEEIEPDETVIAGKMGCLSQAYGGFSPSYNREIKTV